MDKMVDFESEKKSKGRNEVVFILGGTGRIIKDMHRAKYKIMVDSLFILSLGLPAVEFLV